MKLKQLALGCAFAAAAIGAQAASVIDAQTTVVFFSGASAVDNFLSDIANSMMTGVVKYEGAVGAVKDKNYNAWVGTAVSGIPGIPAGTKLALIKRSQGGSAFGIGPVANHQMIRSLNLNDCDTNNLTCQIFGADDGSAGLVPDMGMSDVEPSMFKGINLEPGQTVTANSAFSTITPINQQIFGIVTTDSIPATQHISRSTYGDILSGAYETWDQVDSSLTSVDAQENVVVCRRVQGSGTQASYNRFFNNFPCGEATGSNTVVATLYDSTGIGFVSGSGTQADPFVIDPTAAAGKVIVENSSSGNVRDCMQAAQNHTDHTAQASDGYYYTFKFSNSTKPFRAIAVLSGDSYGKITASTGWHFRMLDGAGIYNMATQTVDAGPGTGIAPSKANLLSGAYDFVLENSLQEAGLSGIKKAFYTEFAKRAGSTKYTGNDGGNYTSVPNAFATLPQVGGTATLVATHTRRANSCAPLQKY
ncbi:hypothetical protein G3580_00350 [Nitrogeniibacter mangrovi]|uniref:PBP domain-containing protein n=1 Tax=Nitrogeniibacter mangrovi TaxID=2016596 RepID=A0A6C1B068_9RHOO|nr:hypothetical protein [Nitrogeniibacter mangrovi]QID16208.1 hypothetical protein G3580_00350 [Nitrogeniibacter mangrovi]